MVPLWQRSRVRPTCLLRAQPINHGQGPRSHRAPRRRRRRRLPGAGALAGRPPGEKPAPKQTASGAPAAHRRAPLDTTAHRRSTPRPPPPQAPRRSRFVLFDTDEDFGAPEVMTGKGRLGSSIDQDGKSNIWAVEPKMQARALGPRDARHRRARARRSSRRAAAAASSRSASARPRRPADPRARARPTRRTAGAVLAVGLIIGSFLFINVEQ